MGGRAVAATCTILAALASPGTAVAAPHAPVAALQVALRAKGLYSGSVDGIAGPGTRRAVVTFQRRAGLAVDGIAGPRTRRALGRRGRPPLGRRVLRERRRGWDVAELQWLLARHGFASGPIDGAFGPRTGAALRRFQGWAGLPADGLAGPATLGALGRPPPRSVLRFLRPLAVAGSDGFGARGARWHTGLDFPAPAGAPVAAAGRGCVVSAGYDAGGYGNLVILGHRLGMTSWYAHLSRIAVRPGQCLAAGALIGRVGATGRASGPHLHFELRLRGAAVDPLSGL